MLRLTKRTVNPISRFARTIIYARADRVVYLPRWEDTDRIFVHSIDSNFVPIANTKHRGSVGYYGVVEGQGRPAIFLESEDERIVVDVLKIKKLQTKLMYATQSLFGIQVVEFIRIFSGFSSEIEVTFLVEPIFYATCGLGAIMLRLSWLNLRKIRDLIQSIEDDLTGTDWARTNAKQILKSMRKDLDVDVL